MPQNRAQKRAAKAKARQKAQVSAPKKARPIVVDKARDVPLDPARAAELGYDAAVGPEPAAWRALDERERLSRVARFHNETLPAAQMPPSMQRHAAMHVLVESQLADARPAEAPAALRRLMDEGMSRHEALHAVGWLTTEHMRRAMDAQRPVDEAAYAADLATLTVRSWLRMAGLSGV
jgi:hypothetical protein